MAPPAPGAAGLDAKDYGAVGDGAADDGPALQAAIDAALTQDVTLLVPAGRYRINSTLNVNTTSPGGGQANRPGLRLVGQGNGLTAIYAAVPMFAVLNYSCVNNPNPALGMSSPYCIYIALNQTCLTT